MFSGGGEQLQEHYISELRGTSRPSRKASLWQETVNSRDFKNKWLQRLSPSTSMRTAGYPVTLFSPITKQSWQLRSHRYVLAHRKAASKFALQRSIIPWLHASHRLSATIVFNTLERLRQPKVEPRVVILLIIHRVHNHRDILGMPLLLQKRIELIRKGLHQSRFAVLPI